MKWDPSHMPRSVDRIHDRASEHVQPRFWQDRASSQGASRATRWTSLRTFPITITPESSAASAFFDLFNVLGSSSWPDCRPCLSSPAIASEPGPCLHEQCTSLSVSSSSIFLALDRALHNTSSAPSPQSPENHLQALRKECLNAPLYSPARLVQLPNFEPHSMVLYGLWCIVLGGLQTSNLYQGDLGRMFFGT